MGKMPSFYGSRGKQKKPLVLSEWIEGHQSQKLILATERDLNVMFLSFSLSPPSVILHECGSQSRCTMSQLP